MLGSKQLQSLRCEGAELSMRLLQSRSHATQRIHNVATGGCSQSPFLKKALAAKSHRQKNPLARLTGVNLCTNASLHYVL